MTVLAPLPDSGTMDVDEFMAFLETRPDGERWDLIEGVAVMMAPASLAQRRITSNFCEALNGAFAARRLDLFAYFGICVRSPGVSDFQPRPDLMVMPGVAGYELHSERFRIVGEVFSSTNTREKIDLKLRRYREAPDNLYVVAIDPRRFLVEVHAKRRGWQLTTCSSADDLIEMPEFGLTCRVLELYRGTPLNPLRQ